MNQTKDIAFKVDDICRKAGTSPASILVANLHIQAIIAVQLTRIADLMETKKGPDNG